MMAVGVVSGALLLVLLTGTSYSYPAKTGSDSRPSRRGSYDTNPGSAASGWRVHSPDEYTVSGSASKTVSKPAHSPSAPREQPRPFESSVKIPAAPPSTSDAFAAPGYSGYSSSPSASSAQPSAFRPGPTEDFAWAVAPAGPPSDRETSRRPTAYRSAPEPAPELAPEPLGSSFEILPVFPVFQAGELSKMENTYEHGNYESETEEQGFQPPPPGFSAMSEEEPDTKVVALRPTGLGRRWPKYPYPYDYMFLTGQYPPGTYTHFSSSFEQGRDHWQDTHYIKDHYPASPTTLEVETFPTAPEAPQHIEQPSQPVMQTAGSASHGQGGGQNPPYRGISQPGSYSEPGGYSERMPNVKW